MTPTISSLSTSKLVNSHLCVQKAHTFKQKIALYLKIENWRGNNVLRAPVSTAMGNYVAMIDNKRSDGTVVGASAS